jgi:hypothetical protein
MKRLRRRLRGDPHRNLALAGGEVLIRETFALLAQGFWAKPAHLALTNERLICVPIQLTTTQGFMPKDIWLNQIQTLGRGSAWRRLAIGIPAFRVELTDGTEIELHVFFSSSWMKSIQKSIAESQQDLLA